MSIGRDNRPKVISFNEKVSGLRVARRKHLLWPCRMYSVSMQAPLDRDLNPFEVLILRLCANYINDVAQLSSKTGFDKELVQFICSRLEQLGLLDERRKLTATGIDKLEALDNVRDDTDAESQTVAAHIYVDSISNTLLPIITSKREYEQVSSSEGKDAWTIHLGSAGQGYEVNATRLPPKGLISQGPPTSSQVSNVIQRYRKRRSISRFLSGERIDQRHFSFDVASIAVEAEYENVYLHTQLLLQEGSDEFLVTDGFGLGFSQQFSEAIVNLEPKWLKHWKSSAQVTELGNTEVESIVHKSTGLSRYPRLTRYLDSAEESYPEAMLNPSSTFTQKQIESKQNKLIKKLYSALEMTFAIVNTDWPVPDWKNYFQQGTDRSNAELIHDYARRLGFQFDKLTKKFLFVSIGKLKRIGIEEPEMQPEVVMAILSAHINPLHPLRKLGREHIDLLIMLSKLKELRDPLQHGKSFEIRQKELKAARRATYRLITALLPELSHALPKETRAKDNLSQAERQRFEISVRLDDEFGLLAMQRMDEAIKSELIRSELIYAKLMDVSHKSQMVDIQPWATAILGIVQTRVFQRISDLDISELTGREVKVKAQENASKAGFRLPKGQLPDGIQTVNLRRAEAACRGINTTIGAEMLAWLVLDNHSQLSFIAKSVPGCLGKIGEMIRHRGHGNRPSYVEGGALVTLRQEMYQIIRKFIEIDNVS